MTTSIQAISDKDEVAKKIRQSLLMSDVSDSFRVSSNVVLDLLQMDEALAEKSFLTNKGIKVQCRAEAEAMFIGLGLTTHHSVSEVMRTLRGFFEVVAVVDNEGRTAIKAVFAPKNLRLL